MAATRRQAVDPGTGASPLVRAILWRRSVRSYTEEPVGAEALEQVGRAAEDSVSVLGQRSGKVVLEADPQRVARLTGCITAGFVGKTNIWLRRANPQAYLVATGHRTRSPRQDDRFFYNVDVGLAGQAAVLAAAQNHVGTCWMAAIDEPSVAEYLSLTRSERVVACTPLGHPRLESQKGWNLSSVWDKMANRLISSRRKPFSEIHFVESFASDQKIEPCDLRDVPADGPDVSSLVSDLAPTAHIEGDPLSDQTLSWMIEACRHAPSADNSQLWRFVTVREESRIKQLLEYAAAGDHADLSGLRESRPGAVLVCAAAPFIIRHRTREQPFFLLDVPIAMMHVMLTARHLDLRWNALVRFDHQAVGRVVALPEKHKVVALLLLGEKESPPKKKTPPPWVQLFR